MSVTAARRREERGIKLVYAPFGGGRRCGPWRAVASFEQLGDLQTFSSLALVHTEGWQPPL